MDPASRLILVGGITGALLVGLTDWHAIFAVMAAIAADPENQRQFEEGIAAATPSTRLDVETIPSFAPNTAARNQPMLLIECHSWWREGNF